jgi:hypothetical protein
MRPVSERSESIEEPNEEQASEFKKLTQRLLNVSPHELAEEEKKWKVEKDRAKSKK